MTCTEIGCGWEASFESQALSLTIPGSRIEVCRNQECFSATFPSDGCPSVPGESRCGWVSFPLWRQPTISAWITQDQRLVVQYSMLPMEQLQDGDVYDIHLAAANGTPVVDARAIATYITVYPNGEGCPGTCLRADLSSSIQ